MILTVAETASTNDDIAARAREGAPEGIWLRAEWQISGRGRQGRAWQSIGGNLHASTLVRLQPGDPPATALALVAPAALYTVVASEIPEHDVWIKWPNDILASDGKLAGILLEREDDAVIAGFGVNLAHAPANIERPAVSLAGLTGRPIDPAGFLERLAESFSRMLAVWRSPGGLAELQRLWLERAHPVGTALTTTIDGARIDGLFDGLDESGALRLRLPGGDVRLIHAGDVFQL